MVAVWLAAIAITRGWASVIQAPYQAWRAMWRDGAAGAYLAAAAVIAPAAIPAGLAAGGLAWSYRIRSMQAGSGGLSPAAAVAFDLRQWRHQARIARARITCAPGSVPLNSRNGDLIAGAVIRAVGHPARQIAAIPYQRMRSHQVVIGTSGTGKTTLLLRLWAGFVASALHRHYAGTGGLSAAGRAGLQGRRGRPPDRRPGPPGAAGRRGRCHRDLAGRGQPVPLGPCLPGSSPPRWST